MSQTEKIKRLIFAVLLFAASAALLFAVGPILAPFLLAALLAYLLEPAIRRFLELGIPLWLALSVAMFYLAAGLYLLCRMMLPLFLEQLRSLLEFLPRLLDNFEALINSVLEQLPSGRFSQQLCASLDALDIQAQELLSHSLSDLIAFILRLPVIAAYLLIAPFLSYYLLRDRKQLAQGLLALVHPQRQGEFLRLTDELNSIARSFFRGYLAVALIIGALSSILYWALGLDYPLVLGLLMALMDMIPYFGPLLGAVPAVLFALTAGPGKALLTAVGIFFLQQIESGVISPRIMGDRVGLHPLLTVFAVLAGGYLFGVAGAILSVPLAAMILLLIKYFCTLVFTKKELHREHSGDIITK